MPLDRETLYQQLGGLVVAIARDCYRIFYPSDRAPAETEDRARLLEEWIQVGWLALLEAVGRYDPTHAAGAKLSTYAALRIRGAIMDNIVENTTVRRPRRRISQVAQQQLREVSRFRQYWLADHGREPTPQELTTHLGITPQDLETLSRKASYDPVELVSVEVAPLQDSRPTPEDAVLDAQAQQRIAKCIEALPEVLRTVLILTQIQGFSLRDAGRVMNLSKDRVHRLRDQALARLRDELAPQGIELEAARGHITCGAQH